jgi:hypothetical protein
MSREQMQHVLGAQEGPVSQQTAIMWIGAVAR